jgi:hypothetical protein
LLGQKILCGRGVLLGLYLVPLRQSRNLAVGEMADQLMANREQVGLLQRSRYALENRGQDAMASRDGQFLLFDALPFLRPFPLDMLWRRCVGMVDAASWIGTDLDHLSALAAVHDDSLRHLVAWPLVGGELTACPVRLGFLDLQLDILIPSQGSAFAGIPRRRNLDSLQLGFQSLFHASVNLGAETVGRSTLCGIRSQGRRFPETLNAKGRRYESYDDFVIARGQTPKRQSLAPEPTPAQGGQKRVFSYF